MQQTVLVTGATGGIGSAVVSRLANLGVSVRILVRDPAKLPLSVANAASSITMGSVLDLATMTTAASGGGSCDAIVSCVDFPPADYAKHIEAIAIAICCAAQTGAALVVPSPKLAIGSGFRVPVNSGQRRPPTTRLGAIRARADVMVREKALEARVPLTLLRLSDVYGPHVRMPMLAPLLEAAIDGRPIVWPGPLDTRIELLFITDAAEAIAKSAINPRFDAEYTVAGFAAVTAGDFCGLIAANTGGRSRIRGSAAFGTGFRKFGPQSEPTMVLHEEVLLAAEPFRQDFGFIPAVDYGTGVRECLRWISSGRPFEWLPGLILPPSDADFSEQT